jgi:hypothetical protein
MSQMQIVQINRACGEISLIRSALPTANSGVSLLSAADSADVTDADIED